MSRKKLAVLILCLASAVLLGLSGVVVAGDISAGAKAVASSVAAGGSQGSLVNINTAGVDELMTLKGVGAKIAQRIVEYREANGPFMSVEDLKNVKGIGEKTLAKNLDRLTVGEDVKTGK